MNAPGQADRYDREWCRFGPDCRSATTSDKPGHRQPGPAAGRGLCQPDELHGQFVIDQLPRLHADLHERVAKDAGRTPGGQIGSAKAVEAPVPLVLGMDVAAREITWTLRVWATRVARVLRGPQRSLADVAGWQPFQAAALLANAFPVLRSLQPGLYPPYVRDGEGRPAPVEDDGPGGIVQLVNLYHRSRSILGETQQHEARHLPCPPPLAADDPDAAPRGGCGQAGTLVRQVGREGVHCVACGWSCTDVEYDLYALTFVPPKSRGRLERDRDNWWGNR